MGVLPLHAQAKELHRGGTRVTANAVQRSSAGPSVGWPAATAIVRRHRHPLTGSAQRAYAERASLDLARTKALERAVGEIATNGHVGARRIDVDLADVLCVEPGIAGQRA